ncbi:hypothetical protein ES703_115883 [subsurface metagenome]
MYFTAGLEGVGGFFSGSMQADIANTKVNTNDTN